MSPLPPVEVSFSLLLLLAESASFQLLSPQGERRVPSLPLGRPGTGPQKPLSTTNFQEVLLGGPARLLDPLLERRDSWKVVVQSDQREDQERQKWGFPALRL